MIIRLAVATDAESIARLHAESWRIAYRGIFRDEFLDGDVFADRNTVWNERLSLPEKSQLVLVAEEAAKLIGFVCAYGDADPEYGTFIDNLHVHPDRKRQGIGRLLLSEVAKWSKQQYPGSGLYLSVLEPNLPARRFYESLGASNRGSRLWEPPGGGKVVDLRYAWSSPDQIFVD